MKDIKEQIRGYILKGYTRRKIMNEMNEFIEKEFNGAYDPFYSLVDYEYVNISKKITKEEYANLKELRLVELKKEKYEEYVRVTSLVKSKTENYIASYYSLQKALKSAIERVAKEEGITEATVRRYVKIIDEEWYFYHAEDRDKNEEYLLENANKIVDRQMNYFVAHKLPGFYKTIKYAKENHPELYEKILNNFASHAPNNYEADNKVKIINVDLLMRVIFEYRIPLDNLYEFIISNKSIFLREELNSVEELYNELNKIHSAKYKQALNWYMHEAIGVDDYTEYRINRFEIFLEEINKKVNTDDKKLYIRSITESNLNGIKGIQINNQNNVEFYRYIIKCMYNFAITKNEMERNLNVQKLDLELGISLLNNNDIYDLMLIDGLNRFNAYINEKNIKRNSL